jgi:hypothetical protein
MRYVRAIAGDNPDCYLECGCAAATTLHIVQAYEWGRKQPALYRQYAEACDADPEFDTTAHALLPAYVKKEVDTKVCANRAGAFSKDPQQVRAKCSAVAFAKEKGIIP